MSRCCGLSKTLTVESVSNCTELRALRKCAFTNAIISIIIIIFTLYYFYFFPVCVVTFSNYLFSSGKLICNETRCQNSGSQCENFPTSISTFISTILDVFSSTVNITLSQSMTASALFTSNPLADSWTSSNLATPTPVPDSWTSTSLATSTPVADSLTLSGVDASTSVADSLTLSGVDASTPVADSLTLSSLVATTPLAVIPVSQSTFVGYPSSSKSNTVFISPSAPVVSVSPISSPNSPPMIIFGKSQVRFAVAYNTTEEPVECRRIENITAGSVTDDDGNRIGVALLSAPKSQYGKWVVRCNDSKPFFSIEIQHDAERINDVPCYILMPHCW